MRGHARGWLWPTPSAAHAPLQSTYGVDRMKRSRRAFLRGARGAAAALALPLTTQPVAAACTENEAGPRGICGDTGATAGILERPAGDPSFEPFWVTTFLPTKLWPTATEVDDPIDMVQSEKLFRVERPQR